MVGRSLHKEIDAPHGRSLADIVLIIVHLEFLKEFQYMDLVGGVEFHMLHLNC